MSIFSQIFSNNCSNKIVKFIYLTIVIFSLILCKSVRSQVNNVHFEPDGKKIQIFYDLEGETGQTFKVFVYCIVGDDQGMGKSLEQVSGDVGDNQIPGRNKKIIWDVLAEKQNLVGELSFVVQAKIIKNVVKFSTRPRNCVLKVDGSILGKTPTKQILSIGDHNISVEKNKYRPSYKSINVSSSIQDVYLQLQRIPKAKSYKWSGRLYLYSSISYAVQNIHDALFTVNYETETTTFNKTGWGPNLEFIILSKNMHFASTIELNVLSFATNDLYVNNLSSVIKLRILSLSLFYFEDWYLSSKERFLSFYIGAGAGLLTGIKKEFVDSAYKSQMGDLTWGFGLRVGAGFRLTTKIRLEFGYNYHLIWNSVNDNSGNANGGLNVFKTGLSFTL